MKKDAARNSIKYKLTMFVTAMLLLQAGLFLGFLAIGGVMDKGKEVAYSSFIETTANRSQYLQAEMKNNWSNIKYYLPTFADKILKSNSEEGFFEDSADDLIKMLTASKASGAFIVLIDNENFDSGLSALYIRDNAPLSNQYSNSDLSYFYGPPDIAKARKITFAQNWSYKLKIDEKNQEALLKTWQNADAQYDISYLAYWSKPFSIIDGESKVITYTLPFYDSKQELRGIIGTEISLSYLSQFLPASEIQTKDSLGYLLAYQAKDEQDIYPVVTTGVLQRRIIDENKPLLLEKVVPDMDFYKLNNHKGTTTIYASLQKINMYYENTPFYDENWYLLAFKEKNSLFSYVQQLNKVFLIAFLMSLLLAIAGSIMASLCVIKPISKLSKQVRDSGGKKKIEPEKTGLYEVDELAKAMAASNNALLESSEKMAQALGLLDESVSFFEYSENDDSLYISNTLQEVFDLTDQYMKEIREDKKLFLEKLALIYSNPEPEEEDVYQLSNEVLRPQMSDRKLRPPMLKWVKIKTIKNKDHILGVAQDVTDNILDKLKIKEERDLDVLTGLYNRGAGERLYRKLIEEGGENIKEAALVMLDLDGLKGINDNYGHNFGDLYIKEAAKRMQIIAKEENTLLFRRSGDEFIFFFYSFSGKDAIREELAFFFDSLHKFPMDFPDGTRKEITISAGLAWYESLNIGYEEIINKADKAMYEAKRNNKGGLIETQA